MAHTYMLQKTWFGTVVFLHATTTITTKIRSGSAVKTFVTLEKYYFVSPKTAE